MNQYVQQRPGLAVRTALARGIRPSIVPQIAFGKRSGEAMLCSNACGLLGSKAAAEWLVGENDQMRVLFTCLFGAGHFQPLIPLARALASAGHDVGFASPANLAPRVEANGFRCLVTPNWSLASLAKTLGIENTRTIAKSGQVPSGSAIELPPLDVRELARRRLFPELSPQALLPDLLALSSQWAPDLVVSDNYEFAGRVAAEAWGIPHASLKVGNVYSYGERQTLVQAMDALRARVGLPADPDGVMLFRYCYFLTEPPGLQADSETLPLTAVRLRHPVDQSGPETRPGWLADLADRPTIYATAGTNFNKTPGLLEDMLAALRDDPVNLILTVGQDRDPAAFGPQPDNVYVERYIPQALVFDACDVVVSHAGTGTMLDALAHGLPMVNIPIAADQPENAARCTAAGCGLTVDAEKRTPEAIRIAVRTVLAEPSYRERARRLQAEMQALPEMDTAVAVLEQLANRRSKSRA
jgi:UDP:flavonoid glycosyltransferase YjiC (YdhE family)